MAVVFFNSVGTFVLLEIVRREGPRLVRRDGPRVVIVVVFLREGVGVIVVQVPATNAIVHARRKVVAWFALGKGMS